MRRLNMKNLHCLSLIACLFATPLFGEELRKADISTALADSIRAANQVRIVTQIANEKITSTVQNPKGLFELALQLTMAEYKDVGLRWHGTMRPIEFWKDSKKLCMVSLDGTEILRIEVPGFGVSDYNVGRKTVEAVEQWSSQVLGASTPVKS
ncbi:MAG: hypothetical protein QM790_01670 [Nibricoccus sp.]